MSPLIELELTTTNVKSHKAKLHTTREQEAHYMLKNTRENLKHFCELVYEVE